MPTTWNPSDRAANLRVSGGNLSAQGVVTVGLAIDRTHNKEWIWNSLNGLWNSATLATQNPATNTGGATIIPTGALFPMWSGFQTGDFCAANFGATSLRNLPAGFSAWDATCTWDGANTGAGITLSQANLVATSSGAGAWKSTRGTISKSSGLLYFELDLLGTGASNGWIIGAGNSSAPLTNYAGSSSASFGIQTQGSAYGGATSGGNFNSDTSWRSVRGTAAANAGKAYFEVTLNSIDGLSGVLAGIATSAAALTAAIGSADNSGVSAQFNHPNGYWYMNGLHTSGGLGLMSAAQTAGFAVDFGTKKIWFYNPATAQWNQGAIGSQNPATGTGGYDISPVLTAPVYPALSLYGYPDRITANFGASAFANTIPSGFSSWDSLTAARNGPMISLIMRR